MGKCFPDIFENLTFLRFSDQLTQISNGNPFFDFLVAFLTGLDLSKKKQDVRTIHFHPLSRREPRHVSENEGFRVYDLVCGKSMVPRSQGILDWKGYSFVAGGSPGTLAMGGCRDMPHLTPIVGVGLCLSLSCRAQA